MKQALILTGWYQKTDSNWYQWLKSQLTEKGYKTFLPDLLTIHTDKPDLDLMLQEVNKTLQVDDETTIIGHSLGCLLAMRIAEQQSYQRMILVSGWDFNDLTEEHQLFWKNPIDHATIKQNVKEIYCVSSDNDPYCTYFINEQMCKRLGGQDIMVKGAGHFTDKDGIAEVPELLKILAS